MTAALFGLFVSGFCACSAVYEASKGDVAWALVLAALSLANLIFGAWSARGAGQ